MGCSFWDRPGLRQVLSRRGRRDELAQWNRLDRIALLSPRDQPAPGALPEEDIAEVVQLRRQVHLRRRNFHVAVAALLILTSALCLLRSAALGWRAGQWAFGLALPIVFGYGCAQVRRRQKTEEALLDGLCPDCGYEVAAGPEITGPARCPECGAMWPLVPPPV